MTYTFTKGKSSIAIGSSSDEVGAVAINGHLILVPVDHAQRIAEALTGRKIAAIVYEDDAMPVVEYDDGSLGAGPAVLPRAHRGNVWNLAIGYAAIARHIEARDAAKGAAERKADEVWDQVKALPVRDAVRRAYELGADSERTEAGA